MKQYVKPAIKHEEEIVFETTIGFLSGFRYSSGHSGHKSYRGHRS